MTNPLDSFKKYKTEKKLAKQIDQTEKSIEKHRMSLEAKKILALQKMKVALEAITEKKYNRFVRKKIFFLKNKIRAFKNKPPLKSKREIKKMSQKAYIETQRYARLKRANSEGMVYVLDIKEYLVWNDPSICSGHLYSKGKHPQVAFNIDNIRPITKGHNKRQAENFGDRWVGEVEKIIGIHKLNKLRKLAMDASLKNELRDYTYFDNMYTVFRDLNQIEALRLGIELK